MLGIKHVRDGTNLGPIIEVPEAFIVVARDPGAVAAAAIEAIASHAWSSASACTSATLPVMAPELPFDPIEEAARQWRQHWGDGPAPAMAAVTSIMRVQQIVMGRLNEILAPHDLTFPRYEALMLLYLSRRGSLPLGKMGVRLQVHRTAVTNLIDGLERSRYLERSPHPSDRRTTLATITKAGRQVAQTATEELNAAQFGTEPLEPRELETLVGIMRGLRAAADHFPTV